MNEPAFPQPEIQYNYGRGMTLRDYFAAKAMQGLILRVSSNWMTSCRGESISTCYL